MSGEETGTRLARLSSAAVRDATGRGWEQWLEALDAAGAQELSHKQIVALLERDHPEVSAWWRQSVTVGYEQARGRRVVGEAVGGFQIGVRRTLDARPEQVWDLLVSRPDLWIGAGARLSLRPGERYEVAGDERSPAAAGEIRVVRPIERLRMTWHPQGWSAPATLQLTLVPARQGRTSVGAHMERLPDADAREAMRRRWAEILERLGAALAQARGRG